MRSAMAATSVVAGVCSISRKRASIRRSACSIPPYSLSDAIIAEIERQTVALAHALGVVGLMNIQFAVKEAGLPDRGQPARQPDGAVRRQGDRIADRQDRRAGDGGGEAGRAALDRPRRSPMSRSRKRCFRSTASPASIRCCRRR